MQTYDEILNSMLEKYSSLTGFVPDKMSDIGIRLSVLAQEIYSNAVNIEWLKKQMFFSTAQGEYLDMHGEPRGIVRRKATKSQGEVTFFINEEAEEDIHIPAGVLLGCRGESLLRFETTASCVIEAGKTSVTVPAQSVGEGKDCNVAPGEISVLATKPGGVHGVTNSKSFVGGCDTESDESLRNRIRNSINTPPNGTNCAYYKSLAESIDGVSSAQVVPKGRGVGTVDVYIAADGTEVSDDTVVKVQELISSEREVNVDAKVLKATPVSVSVYMWMKAKTGYDYEKVKDACIQVLEAYIQSRGVGEDVLMCHICDCVAHVEGVSEYALVPQLNGDVRNIVGNFPVAGPIEIGRGEL